MRLLVIRLSAMGDVALVVLALKAVLNQYPDLQITMLTRSAFVPLFGDIDRVNCKTADVKNKHKGLLGLYQLYKEIKHQYKPDTIIDLHDVLRSWILCALFKTDRIPCFRIDKGRKEKKALTRKKDKTFIQLKHSANRYLDVFAKAGYTTRLSEQNPGFESASSPEAFLNENLLLPKKQQWIGMAPFARHREKMWPLKKMKAVIQDLTERGCIIFLFGGGQTETEIFKQLKLQFPPVIIVAGNLPLTNELGLMKRLDLMISMDSANMHLAAISGIPVISIWGATHPYAGFAPLNGNEKYILQIPHSQLSCRPCSVFGNKPCFRGDHACMEWIEPKEVLHFITNMLKEKDSI